MALMSKAPDRALIGGDWVEGSAGTFEVRSPHSREVINTVARCDSSDVDRAVASAKLMANEAAIDNGKTCVQVHGGMGYTWEVDVHLFLKRAWLAETQFGSADTHADRLAATLAAG